MSKSKNTKKCRSRLERAGEELFNFATDRQDVKWLMARLPETAKIQRALVEHELQILKIVITGWSISYFLNAYPQRRNHLVTHFWQAIRGFAGELSAATEMLAGQDIDYFQTLKERLDSYLAVMRCCAVADPVVVMGPEFARICGNPEDVFTVMTGSRMFTLTTSRVKEYLEKL
jgi:hypothetical protein